MPRYVIEREIPGAGKLTGDQLQGISQRCCGVLWKLGPEIQWIDIMGNWIPDDPTLVAQILRISSSYSPPPPEGFISPMTWEIENNVIKRFAGAGVPKEKISFVRDTYTFNFPSAPSELAAAFRKYYGPTMNAFDAAEKNGRAADLAKQLEVLFNSKNKSPSKDTTSIPATFLRVTVAL